MNDPDDTTQQASEDSGRWQYLKPVVALLLIVAAFAKLSNVVPILAGEGLLSTRPLLFTVIAFEVAAGIYMLVGNQFWSWVLMLVMFSVFTVATTYGIVSGKSCNCIAVAIGPEIMLPLDLTFLGLAAWIRPRFALRQQLPSIWRVTGCIAAGCVIAGIASLREASTDRSDPLEYLLADDLVNKAWPLGSAFHPQLAPLESGRWMIFMVRHDCEHCRELIATYFADPTTHREGERTAVLVAGSDRWPFKLDHVSLDFDPDGLIEWPLGEPFVASPAILTIDGGTVSAAADGPSAADTIESLLADHESN